MDTRHPIDVDLAEVVPEPPDTALPWNRLQQQAERRQRHWRAGLAAVAVLALAAVGAGTQWWADRPVPVQQFATSTLAATPGAVTTTGPTMPPASAPATTHAASTEATVAVSGDLDGDGRPDTVTLSGSRLSVLFATGQQVTRPSPDYGGLQQLQAVSDLIGLGRAQILIGGTAAGCCVDKPAHLESQILVYEGGTLRPILVTDGRPFTLSFNQGSGNLFEGVTCRSHGRIEQYAAEQLDLAGGHTLTKTVYQVTAHQARLVSQHRSMVAGGSGAFQAMIRATATHCPGLPSDGIPLGRTVS